MKSRLPLVCISCVLMFAITALADEKVTLKSGARLIGKVSYSGDQVVVQIGESQVSLPMRDVDVISAVGTEPRDSADRLLMIALESKLQFGSSEGLIGLLAEAHRKAPDDPRIAYWYASSLADGQLAKEAQRILQSHRAGIEQTYPGLAESLADRIESRLALVDLPPKLITKIDLLNAAAEDIDIQADRLPMYVRFRVVDQQNHPIEPAAIYVESDGNDESLQSFGDGYFLYSYYRHRNDSPSECHLNINWPGIESKTADLTSSAENVADAGVVSVRRFDDNDKLPITFAVVNRDGKPIEGATVELTANVRNSRRGATNTSRTDADGKTTIQVFPMNYNYGVSAQGFKSNGGEVEIESGDKDLEQKVELFPTMAATIRIVWMTKGVQGELVSTKSEAVLKLGEGVQPMPYGPDSMNFLRPIQVGDQISLQSGPPYFGGPMMQGVETWIRSVPQDLLKDKPLDYFTEIDLAKIDDLKSTLKEVDLKPQSRGGYPPFSFPVKQGEVYVGKLPSRDMRNGQPMMVSFKAYVEEVKE